MLLDMDYCQALRNCCRDEAAFVQLQQILAAASATATSLATAKPCQCLDRVSPPYEAILDAIPDCMFRFDGSGLCIDFRSNCSGVQASEATFVGKNLSQFLPVDVAELGFNTIRKTLETKSVQTCEYQLLTERGLQDYEARLAVSGVNEVLAIVRNVTERKQAEAALAKSEQWYRALIQHSTDVIHVIGADGTYQYLSPSIEQILGFKPEELLGKTCWDLIYPEDLPLALAALESCLQQPGVPVRVTLRVRHKAGHWVYFETSGRNLLEEPAVRGIVVNARDINERKQAEEKFFKAFRQSPDFVTISTLAEGRYVEANDSFLRVFGYTREEVIGHTAHELNIWTRLEDRDRMKQQLQESGIVKNLECEFRFKSGEVCTGLLSAEAIELNGVECLLAVTHDITERKQAEIQLQMTAKRDRILSEMAQRIRQSLECDRILKTTVEEVRQYLGADRVLIGRIESNHQCKIIAESFSSACPSCLGITIGDPDYIQEIQKFHVRHDILAIDDVSRVKMSPARAQFMADYQVKATLGVPIMLEDRQFGFLVVHQCDRPRHWQQYEQDLLRMLATQVAIAIQQGQLYQQVQNAKANLEHLVAERTQELQQNMQELQTLNQLKDLLLHAVAHDLRTPVLGTLMLLKNLSNRAENQAKIAIPRSTVDCIIQSSDRQVHLINALLQAHADETTKLDLYRQPLNLKQVSEKVLDNLTPVLSKNQATVTNFITEDLPLINADKTYFCQLIENLIINALKHNPPGRHILLNAQVEKHQIRCAIADDGIGLTPEKQSRLFDLYVRGLDCHHLTGIGLGLYLCRQIVTAHGGKIGVTSSPGAGATFWFTLPL